MHKQRRGRKEQKERLWHPISTAKSGRKKKSEDKRATRPYHPRSDRGAPRAGLKKRPAMRLMWGESTEQRGRHHIYRATTNGSELDLFQRREKERSCRFEGAQAAKGEEGAEGATLASDFNRQERWKEEIGGQESNKALPPPERPRCTKSWPKKAASYAFSVGRVA
ncbi:hypothetical protein B2I21_33855 [Chryseobacterium mucoviscidosis]|nr:hypothetical protein B2I21_33855 [Chryseobacterium mucoviscidosis]